MKSEQIKHSLSIDTKSIQSRVFDSETDEVISFVKIPIKDSGLVRCEKGTREMNNEPVAYVDPKELQDDFTSTTVTKKKFFVDDVPLYTHPVKEQDCYGDGNVYRGVRSKDSEVQTIYFNPVKELTDEEINLLAKAYSTMEGELNAPAFARAILRKAQEK